MVVIGKKSIYSIVIPLLIIVNGLLSVNQWSKLPLGNTTINWVVNLLIVLIIVYYKYSYSKIITNKDNKIVSLYLVWLIINAIRGLFIADNYWEYKQLIDGTFALILPLTIYYFSSPQNLFYTLRMWLKFGLPLFIVMLFILRPTAYHFYLGPIFLFAFFTPILNNKWKITIVGLLMIMVFADFGARSQVLKAIVSLFIIIAIYFRRFFTFRNLKYTQISVFAGTLILLFLGIFGNFNIFQNMTKHEGKFTETSVVNGDLVIEDLTSDTRSLLYEEVIGSAINNNYWIWGRTPARGNDSANFGYHVASVLGTGKFERHSNEVLFPNVFTWLGIIGLVLYACIYIKSSYLALYKSKNIFMKLIGLYIAFRFMYGWIEDFNRFDIMNISLWMIIAMGFSLEFRSMNNQQIIYWAKSLFKNL